MSTLRIALFLYFLSCGAGAAQPAKVDCLWTALPTVVQTRLELSIRLGEDVPVAVLNRFPDGALAKFLIACGYDDSMHSFALAHRYWLARAAYEISKTRLKLTNIVIAPLEAFLEKNTPLPFRAAIGEAVANRKPGRAKQIILQLLETVEAARQTRGEPPMTLLQKRLLIAFAATRLVLMGFADQ